jgi:hypothetical protein
MEEDDEGGGVEDDEKFGPFRAKLVADLLRTCLPVVIDNKIMFADHQRDIEPSSEIPWRRRSKIERSSARKIISKFWGYVIFVPILHTFDFVQKLCTVWPTIQKHSGRSSSSLRRRCIVVALVPFVPFAALLPLFF